MKKHIKRIVYDIIGVILVIVSPFLGAIPGPGGMIVLFAGLSILAMHNEWAARLLQYLKDRAENLFDIIFIRNKKAELANDIIGLLFIATSATLFFVLSGTVANTAAGLFLSAGCFWLLYNRQRYKKFLKKR